MKRQLVLAVYLLTPYLGIVGLWYGVLFGYGASLSVFGLAGVSIVAAYYSRFAAVLYVGYVVTVDLGGYLFPIALERFTGLTALGPSKVDAVSHILSVIVPLTLIALRVRGNPPQLFR